MTSPHSSVDLGGLRSTAQSQDEAIQAGRTQLNNVVQQAETLSSSWQGQAATQFHQALENFQENGNAVLRALQNMQDAMNSTHGVFSNAHEETVNQAGQAQRAMAQRPGLPGL